MNKCGGNQHGATQERSMPPKRGTWRKFFRNSMPIIPDLPGSGAAAGARSATQGARSTNLKTEEKFLDEKGINLDL